MNETLQQHHERFLKPELGLDEAALTPSVREALERAEALDADALDVAIETDKASSFGSWSARDYTTQRLTAIRGLQQLIDLNKTLGKDVTAFEASLRSESDRLARFLLHPEKWQEPEQELLKNTPDDETNEIVAK